MLIEFIEWGACAASVAGGLLLALDNGLSRYGWALFLVSNVLWMGYGFLTGAEGLLAQQAFFVAINVTGLARWMRPGRAR